MSGLKIVPQGVAEIMSLTAPSMSYEKPNLEEAFAVEHGTQEDEEEVYWPRAARKFVSKMRRKEARLRAKGRIA